MFGIVALNLGAAAPPRYKGQDNKESQRYQRLPKIPSQGPYWVGESKTQETYKPKENFKTKNNYDVSNHAK